MPAHGRAPAGYGTGMSENPPETEPDTVADPQRDPATEGRRPDEIQEENAGTSLDQPSEDVS